jgi:hypothetical protein
MKKEETYLDKTILCFVTGRLSMICSVLYLSSIKGMEITIIKVSRIPAVKNKNSEKTKAFKRMTKKKGTGIRNSLVI